MIDLPGFGASTGTWQKLALAGVVEITDSIRHGTYHAKPGAAERSEVLRSAPSPEAVCRPSFEGI